MGERRIRCPGCGGTSPNGCTLCYSNIVGWVPGTIPDRRKPTAADRAVERIKAYVEKFPIVRNDEYHNGYNEAIDKIESIIREEAERGEGEQLDALRAEVVELKCEVAMLKESTEQYRAEVAALNAELARFTEPLTDEQARAVLLVESTRPNHSAEDIVMEWDAAIREVRSK